MADPTRNLLVCQAIRLGRPAVPSRKFFCVECGERIWVSLSMVRPVMTGELRPMCGPCGLAAAEADPDSEWRLHPDQEPELAAYDALNFSQQVIEAMKKREDRGCE